MIGTLASCWPWAACVVVVGTVARVEDAVSRLGARPAAADAARRAEGRLVCRRADHPLGLLMVLVGPPLQGGLAQPSQRIVIGLSRRRLRNWPCASSGSRLPAHAPFTARRTIEHVMGLQDKLYNANSVIYLCRAGVVDRCLWIDEPGAASAAEANDQRASCRQNRPRLAAKLIARAMESMSLDPALDP